MSGVGINVSHEVLHKADVVWDNALHRLGDDGIRAVLALARLRRWSAHELRQVQPSASANCSPRGNLAWPDVYTKRSGGGRCWRAICAARPMQGDLQWLILRAPGEVLGPTAPSRPRRCSNTPEPHECAAAVFLDALLVTANGKIDHRALLRPAANTGGKSRLNASFRKNRSDRGYLWHDLLKAGDIGPFLRHRPTAY